MWKSERSSDLDVVRPRVELRHGVALRVAQRDRESRADRPGELRILDLDGLAVGRAEERGDSEQHDDERGEANHWNKTTGRRADRIANPIGRPKTNDWSGRNRTGRPDLTLRKLGGIGAITGALLAAGLWSGAGSAGWLGSAADPMGLKATLGTGQEVPKPNGVRGNAGGSFTGGLTRKGSGGTLAWRLTFRGLTGAASSAHVHLAKRGVAGPVAVPLCGPCRSGARGTAKLNARTVNALLGGGAYVNVHTARNPAGEIRGQIRKGGSGLPVPTGSTTTTTRRRRTRSRPTVRPRRRGTACRTGRLSCVRPESASADSGRATPGRRPVSLWALISRAARRRSAR